MRAALLVSAFNLHHPNYATLDTVETQNISFYKIMGVSKKYWGKIFGGKIVLGDIFSGVKICSSYLPSWPNAVRLKATRQRYVTSLAATRQLKHLAMLYPLLYLPACRQLQYFVAKLYLCCMLYFFLQICIFFLQICICIVMLYMCRPVVFMLPCWFLDRFLTDFWTDSWADFLIEFGTDFWIDFQTNYQKSLLGNFAGNFLLSKLKIVCRAAICLALYKALSVWIWLDRWKKKNQTVYFYVYNFTIILKQEK